MRNIKRVFWASLALLTLLWLAAEPGVFKPPSVFGLRPLLMQLTGFLAIGSMSLAMVLALRPRWPERALGGLDKMYRLHKWLGITALVMSVTHWLWAKGPKWAVGWGWLERPPRGPRVPAAHPVEALFQGWRGTAEDVGEWAFYAAVLLMALALVRRFPYRWFYKTHRLIAVVFLVLVFHSVVLIRFDYWSSPIAWLSAVLMLGGAGAALVSLTRRVGASRWVDGRIVGLTPFSGVRSLEVEVELSPAWPGHRAGQFAFVVSDPAEGPHPYTIASGWQPADRRVVFIAKELGDHTSRLRDKLSLGQKLRVEGPYGCFTFDDDRPCQIWVGAGIGITPFIARMRQMAADAPAVSARRIHLFHCSAEVDDEAFKRLAALAETVGVQLHLFIDSRDGRLTGERIREQVPEWAEASLWFCGPAGFGESLRDDFKARGLAADRHFHQELFAMR